jgi:hypothetical protein
VRILTGRMRQGCLERYLGLCKQTSQDSDSTPRARTIMRRKAVLDWILCCVAASCAFNAAYRIAEADPCGCSQVCHVYTGVAWGRFMGQPIYCNNYDAWTAIGNYWCNNPQCIGGMVMNDGANTVQYQSCDDNSCQMYCIPCSANGFQQSDKTMNGCQNIGMPQQRSFCKTGDLSTLRSSPGQGEQLFAQRALD